MTTTESWTHCRERLINIFGVNRFQKSVTRWSRAITSIMVRENCSLIEAVQILSCRDHISLQQIAVLKAVAAEMKIQSK